MEKIHLEAGLPILIELSGSISLDTHVIGFESGGYIIVKSGNAKNRPEINVKSPCSAKLLYEGTVYTFNSEVLSVLTSPAQLIFLKYPSNIEVVQLRRDKRFRANLPAVFKNNTQNFIIRQVTLTDISMQGCRIRLPEGTKHPDFMVDDICKVSFIVMYKYFEVLCIVKNIYEGDNVTCIGMEFTEIKEPCKELLKGMINILEVQGE